METPETTPRRSRWPWLDAIPNPVVAIALALSLVQVGMAAAPAGVVRRIWRLVEVSPARINHAAEASEWMGLVRPYLGHMFFHINLLHYVVNLAAIIVAGTLIYREMQSNTAPGKSDPAAAFIAFFLLCGMAGAFAFVALNPKTYMPMIGASGAAAGLFGALVLIAARRDWPALPLAGAAKTVFVIVAISAALLIINFVLYAFFNFALDFLQSKKIMLSQIPGWRRQLNIWLGGASAWQAHAGGYLFGLIACPLFERMARASR